MPQYNPENKGVITIKSEQKHKDKIEISSELIQNLLNKIDRSFDGSLWSKIPYILRKNQSYKIDFNSDKKNETMSNDSFYETLCEYGYRLNQELTQQSICINFDKKTELLIKSADDKLDWENALKSKVIPYLEKGRPNWDAPHTLETVDWIKRLLKTEGGNRKILISTMYLHDIGWYNLFDDEDCNYDKVKSKRDEHMKQGAKLSREILNELHYSPDEIDRIAHIVSIHDNLKKIESPYEFLVMEADVLGQLSAPQKNTGFSRDDYIKFTTFVKDKRRPLFRTKTGKMFLDNLLSKIEQTQRQDF